MHLPIIWRVAGHQEHPQVPQMTLGGKKGELMAKNIQEVNTLGKLIQRSDLPNALSWRSTGRVACCTCTAWGLQGGLSMIHSFFFGEGAGVSWEVYRVCWKEWSSKQEGLPSWEFNPCGQILHQKVHAQGLCTSPLSNGRRFYSCRACQKVVSRGDQAGTKEIGASPSDWNPSSKMLEGKSSQDWVHLNWHLTGFLNGWEPGMTHREKPSRGLLSGDVVSHCAWSERGTLLVGPLVLLKRALLQVIW